MSRAIDCDRVLPPVLYGIDPLLWTNVKVLGVHIPRLRCCDTVRGVFLAYGRPVQRVEVCGHVASLANRDGKIIMTVDDGSGEPVEATVWLTRPNGSRRLSPPALEIGSIVRLAGKLREYQVGEMEMHRSVAVDHYHAWTTRDHERQLPGGASATASIASVQPPRDGVLEDCPISSVFEPDGVVERVFALASLPHPGLCKDAPQDAPRPGPLAPSIAGDYREGEIALERHWRDTVALHRSWYSQAPVLPDILGGGHSHGELQELARVVDAMASENEPVGEAMPEDAVEPVNVVEPVDESVGSGDNKQDATGGVHTEEEEEVEDPFAHGGVLITLSDGSTAQCSSWKQAQALLNQPRVSPATPATSLILTPTAMSERFSVPVPIASLALEVLCVQGCVTRVYSVAEGALLLQTMGVDTAALGPAGGDASLCEGMFCHIRTPDLANVALRVLRASPSALTAAQTRKDASALHEALRQISVRRWLEALNSLAADGLAVATDPEGARFVAVSDA
jgi:hypothetical protein